MTKPATPGVLVGRRNEDGTFTEHSFRPPGPRAVTVTYAYAIGERIAIRETGHPGIVTGMLTDSNGDQYRVVWWNNGERKQDFLYGHEIEARK